MFLHMILNILQKKVTSTLGDTHNLGFFIRSRLAPLCFYIGMLQLELLESIIVGYCDNSSTTLITQFSVHGINFETCTMLPNLKLNES